MRRLLAGVLLILVAIAGAASASASGSSVSGSWAGSYRLVGPDDLSVAFSGKRALVDLGASHAEAQSVPLTTARSSSTGRRCRRTCASRASCWWAAARTRRRRCEDRRIPARTRNRRRVLTGRPPPQRVPVDEHRGIVHHDECPVRQRLEPCLVPALPTRARLHPLVVQAHVDRIGPRLIAGM